MEALTNLQDINADHVRLWDNTDKQHKDIRDLFLSTNSFGNYENGEFVDVNDNQIARLQDIINYLSIHNPSAPINNHYHVQSHHKHVREGDSHTFLKKKTHVHHHKHFIMNNIICPITLKTQHKHVNIRRIMNIENNNFYTLTRAPS